MKLYHQSRARISTLNSEVFCARNILRVSAVIYAGFDVVDINEDGPDDMEGLDVAAAHVANLLSNEPADSKFSFQTCIFIPIHVVTEIVYYIFHKSI